ncbi:hypothetical protein JCM10914A_18600 [Paenibacillus sp. JCM 10914]|uniref:hypothetical protein n=1 Tax=Paenibacillus sp. JCM 10914 TaxID=1236974 RepID=UPI0003CC92B5|nr:hypothetical protein [Paenibacillus sp. JCM 10914]GAE06268.1 hypothetical protein JCM10914_2416 [Paenibacillus sp. JCM 10914]
MNLSEIQQQALDQAEKHGGRLIRWKQAKFWTYEAAIVNSQQFRHASELEWCCTTNTIFALVRRGYMVMDDWGSCSLVPRKTDDGEL